MRQSALNTRPSCGTVLFRDGRWGSYVIYWDHHTDRLYVYRTNANRMYVRAYIVPGESVEWMETADPALPSTAA